MRMRHYRHYMPLLLTSEQFRGVNKAVYEIGKTRSSKYTSSDFIREAIDDKLQKLKLESLMKEENKK